MFERPALWERSAEPFWDDEHISKGMLEAHLNPSLEAASRTKETIERSVDWIASIIPKNCRMLDLGCGPGLYCRRFSERGFDVAGMDFSRRSISYAAANDKLTKYIYKNYLELDYTDEFDVITMIYCDYAALTAAERQLLLSKIRLALKPGGIFIFDVFSNLHNSGNTEKKEWSSHEHGGFWSPDPYIDLNATYLYENGTVSAARSIIVTEYGMKEYLIWDTSYDLKRLKEEVLCSGLAVDAVYDDACGKEYTGKSETICAVLKK